MLQYFCYTKSRFFFFIYSITSSYSHPVDLVLHLSCSINSHSTFIIVMIFFVATQNLIFLRLHFPFHGHGGCCFFLYNSCSSHATSTYYIDNSTAYSIRHSGHFYAQLIDKKNILWHLFFLFLFFVLRFFFRRHSSFVQSSILYYIEFSAIAFVLFNLKKEQSRNMNVKKKFVRFFQCTKKLRTELKRKNMQKRIDMKYNWRTRTRFMMKES